MAEYYIDILNQIRREMCDRCPYKYWEACTGPHEEWGILCCRKARERYEKLLAEKEKNKWLM